MNIYIKLLIVGVPDCCVYTVLRENRSPKKL